MIMFHHNFYVKCLPFVEQTIDYFCCTRVGEEKKQRSSQVTIKMRNVMMQLRKCCNHPYLLEHPVDPKTGELALTQDVITVSGKMLVLDKMLAELKKRGHRVSLFHPGHQSCCTCSCVASQGGEPHLLRADAETHSCCSSALAGYK